MNTALILIAAAAGLGVLYMAIALVRERPARRVAARMGTHVVEEDVIDEAFLNAAPWSIDWVSRWLYLAGLRKPGVTLTFFTAQALFFVAGLLVKAWMQSSPVIANAGAGTTGMGGVMLSMLGLVPWVAFGAFAAIPILYVKSKRQKIVDSIDKDLPVTLELLATLGRGGMGVDAALAKILEAQDVARPLARELRAFQVETLSGVARVECFRRLAGRLGHTSVTIFVSSLIQAESIGSALGEVLRRQADSLWSRRREQALMKAQTLPVKLAIPLVTCFLPPIYIFTLGPPFLQFLDSALANIR
ncbi:MAG: type II secretion system F family protein [Planctomycetota bacterium]